MKCFYHNASFAVGTCKNCGKGICKKCAVDLADGLACRNKCEEKVKGIIELVSRNTRATKDFKNIYSRSMIFTFLTAALFIGFGVYSQLYLLIGIGALYLFVTLSTYRTMKKVQ